MATKRIKKEIRDFLNSPVEGIEITPSDSDIFKWVVTLDGPKETPYEGGKFDIDVAFPCDYPWKPPVIKMLTPCFHVNVNEEGFICMDILKNSWTPALTVSKTMLSFLAFLMTPNADHALVPERAQLLKSNPDQYYEKVKEWTLKFATKKGTSM